MKNKLLSVLLILNLFFTPALADGPDAPEYIPPQSAEQTAPATETAAAEPQPVAEERQYSADELEDMIYYYAHTIADSYYYGISDSNLLYAIICSTIENGGVFDIDLALESMIDILGDQYAEFFPADLYQEQVEYYSGEFFGIGVVLTIGGGGSVINSVFADSPAEEAGLLAGDKIMTVDGVDVSAMGPAEVSSYVSGEENTPVNITVMRGGELISTQAVRKKVTESHSSLEILENKIACIDIRSFTATLPEEFDKYIEQINGLGITNVLIDLRGNGGGDLDAAISVAQKLIPAGVIGKIKTYRDGAVVEDVKSENQNAPNYNILVLVDENTASASEFLAMALHESGRAKLLGVDTYGKGCMQAMMRTPTGSGIKFTIGEYFTPGDKRVNTVGLAPDFFVENVYTPVDAVKDFSAIDFSALDSEATRLGVEQRLNVLGLLPDSETDGVFNLLTEAAITTFQSSSSLEPTGLLDFYTALRINDFEYDEFYHVTDVQTEEAVRYFLDPTFAADYAE